jgi:hypothetical protein
MDFEFEEFDSAEDIFIAMSTMAPPMKNILPVNSYKGYIFSIIPLTPASGNSYLMIYVKGKLDGKLLEFDMNLKKIQKCRNCRKIRQDLFCCPDP